MLIGQIDIFLSEGIRAGLDSQWRYAQFFESTQFVNLTDVTKFGFDLFWKVTNRINGHIHTYSQYLKFRILASFHLIILYNHKSTSK